MSTTSILLLVVALIPLVGNVTAFFLRRAGKATAADWVVRMTPLALVAASSKTREEAITRLTEEVMRLTGPESVPAKVAATTVLVKSVPPPSSAAGVLPILLLALLATQHTACAELKQAGKVAAPMLGSVLCSLISTDAKNARMACHEAVDIGSGALENLGTNGGSTFERAPKSIDYVSEVPIDDVAAFCSGPRRCETGGPQ